MTRILLTDSKIFNNSLLVEGPLQGLNKIKKNNKFVKY